MLVTLCINKALYLTSPTPHPDHPPLIFVAELASFTKIEKSTDVTEVNLIYDEILNTAKQKNLPQDSLHNSTLLSQTRKTSRKVPF